MLDPNILVLNEETLKFIIKVVILFIEVFYVAFAFIVIRRVKLMNSSFHTSLAGFFSLAAFIHFVSTIVLTLLTLLIV